ncbi:SDR family NAD(P)-dependent oxidoreductase [Pedococcus sp. 5OH_020]|uniref:SDR family NAD(P)-dependent oxidoreductase n=1 Tax=Pedococcus sp. 5OH_020 TaxID=2989814 RepID=UPI0022EA08ED|nr:SDR family oxidoreductase [Pedococcus sp. 5OH_020]
MTQSPVALVVGSSRGLGLELARELLTRGHVVVLAARDPDELDRAAAGLDRGDRVQVRVCDVRVRDDVAQLVRWCEAEVGPVEVAITVAGIIDVGPVEAIGWETYEDALATMTWGPIHVALQVLPAMRARGHGRIGTITSIGGMVAPPHLVPYATAKFGAVGFSDGLAAELTGTGVTATTAVPGLMRTGGHVHARFTGQAQREYAWFAPGGSLPLLSSSSGHAARKIVRAILAGRPFVTVTPLAWVGIRVRGLAPGTTIRLMGLMGRLLPSAPGTETATSHTFDEDGTVPRLTRSSEGGTLQRVIDSRLLDVLTTLGTRAARRNNQQ